MVKKTIILKESELIELIESTVNDIQEQSYSKDKILSGDYNPDSPNYQVQSNFDKKQREAVKKAYNDFMYNCEKHRKKAKNMARRIVGEDFEGWTTEDTDWFNYYAEEGAQPCTMINQQNWTMNEWVSWAANDEPGWCENPWHCILPVLAVGALFISGPAGWGAYASYAGLGISIGLEAIDAAMYLNEGDEQMAGLVMGLAVLPLVGKIVKKFPFVKNWGKGSEMYLKIINGKSVSVLEFYQTQALKNNAKFIEREVLDYVAEKTARESIEFAGQKVTKESLDEAMKKGYMEVTVDGVTHKVTQEMFNGLTQFSTTKMIEKTMLYTAKQQSILIKFGKLALPYVIAGVAYTEIYNKIAKTGAMGPKKQIEKLWGIDVDDTGPSITSKFFLKMAGLDASTIPDTKWKALKILFYSDSSAVDGEKMVQAIKAGWNPLKLPGHGDILIVPKKYRTEGYNEFVNKVLSNEFLTKEFMSDGSDKDNELLLLFIIEYQEEWEGYDKVPEKYQTETYKKQLEVDGENAPGEINYWEEEGFE